MLKNNVTDYVSVTLNSDLVPEVRIVCGTDSVLLPKKQWFILISLKNCVPNNIFHNLGDSRYMVTSYCGRYVHIVCDSENIILTFSQWESLMEIADMYINMDLIGLIKVRQDLVSWKARCLRSGMFAEPPKTDIPGFIDFEVLYTFMGRYCL